MRCKDAGSADSQDYRRDRGRSSAPPSAADGTAFHFGSSSKRAAAASAAVELRGDRRRPRNSPPSGTSPASLKAEPTRSRIDLRTEGDSGAALRLARTALASNRGNPASSGNAGLEDSFFDGHSTAR